jgi:hypothetical protein
MRQGIFELHASGADGGLSAKKRIGLARSCRKSAARGVKSWAADAWLSVDKAIQGNPVRHGGCGKRLGRGFTERD